MKKILQFLCNIVWLSDFRKDCIVDHYGELVLIFFIFPYRLMVLFSVAMGLLFGVKALGFLFVVLMFHCVLRTMFYIDRYSPYLQKKHVEARKICVEKSEARRKAQRQAKIDEAEGKPYQPIKLCGGK